MKSMCYGKIISLSSVGSVFCFHLKNIFMFHLALGMAALVGRSTTLFTLKYLNYWMDCHKIR